jgi:hypothetical protein
MDFRRDDDGCDGIVQHRVDPAPRWAIDGYLRMAAPTRMHDPEQLLDDPGLDVIPNERARIRIQADGQVGSERVGHRDQCWKARVGRPKLKFIQVASADARCLCHASQR